MRFANIKRLLIRPEQVIALVAFLLFVAGYFTNSIPAEWLALKPERVLQNFELWRLVTYPLVASDACGLLLFCYAVFVLVPRIEAMFNMYRFSILMPMILLLQGIVYTFVFGMGGHVLCGTDAVTICSMLLPMLVYPRRRSYYLIATLKMQVHVSLMFLVLWACIIFYRTNLYMSENIVINATVALIFGGVSALIILNRINAEIELSRAERLRNSMLLRVEKPFIGESGLSPADCANIKKSEQFVRQLKKNLEAETNHDNYVETLSNEANLNKVLDKINDYGKESLTDDEKRFLYDYSKNMK